MKLLTGKFIFLLIAAKVFSQAPLREEYQALVEPFVEAVRNNDKEKIASLTRYPLRRQYPIPYIYNEQEMLARYDQIFDEKLIDIIKNSSIETDWSDVGWRGIMLNNGVIWIDYDGMVRRINYQSSQENRIRNDIILELKNSLHESLREFTIPCLVCETESYKIRVDLLQDNNYRLALWSKEKEQNENPNIVLINGSRTIEGSAGEQVYLFDYDNHQYILWIGRYTGSFIVHKGMSIRLRERIDENDILVDEKIIKIEY